MKECLNKMTTDMILDLIEEITLWRMKAEQHYKD